MNLYAITAFLRLQDAAPALGVKNSHDTSELFTVTSLVSLQGAAAAALMVPAVLNYLSGDKFKPYAKFVSFAIAMSLSLVVAGLADKKEWTTWRVAVFNGFLVFSSAVGINQTVAQGTSLGQGKLFRSWF